MLSKFPVEVPRLRLTPGTVRYGSKRVFRVACCEANGSSSESEGSSASSMGSKFGFHLVGGDKNWKLSEIDTNIMQETVNQLLSRTRNFLSEMAAPIVKKSANDGKTTPRTNDDDEDGDIESILNIEQTFDSRIFGGELSEAAVVSIEQFSRMNGQTGKKMLHIFKALVPEHVYYDPRNFVEYCCLRFLSRNAAEVHPGLKESAFRGLVFITMLAWENPHKDGRESQTEKDVLQKNKGPGKMLKSKLVGEDAFVRIAPTVSGVADYPTAHNLFKALSGDSGGISYNIWSTYLRELLKVHDGRNSDQLQDFSYSAKEKILCLGSSRKQPVIRWERNTAWPGMLTLTDKALYFEAVGLVGEGTTVRRDLSRKDSRVEKTRVGPLGSNVFDSAISVSSGLDSEPLVLEFVDLKSEMRRDVWFAFVNEVIAFHRFLNEYGPKAGDQSVFDVYGAQRGSEKARTYTANAVARLQALHFMRRTLDDPTKLLPFSYLENAPYGDTVLETLAVNFWGGPMIKKPSVDEANRLQITSISPTPESSSHVFDIDGSVYLRKWMASSSWRTNASLAFWKSMPIKRGVVLSKNLVVAGMTMVERAAMTCKDKYRVVERTQATIDAATIEGIPSNIDLFKELVLPFTMAAHTFERLRRWEDPIATASFLGLSYLVLSRNLLPYILPISLISLSCVMLLLKGLKEQGRLGRFFGQITIFDQPPSNTIQKIIALKEAMREMEKYLQNVNVILLKIRSILLAGHPQVTTEVSVALLVGAAVLFMIPFKYIAGVVIFDLFTRELEFRRKMVVAFMRLLKERWDMIPAAPVVVLPYEHKESNDHQMRQKLDMETSQQRSY